MNIRLPQYTTRDYSVMFWVTVPFICIVNSAIFGSRFFSEWKVFVVATIIGWTGLCIDFIVCGFVAVALKKRLPAGRQVSKRLTLMILVFWLLTGLFLYTLFRLYEKIELLDYTFNEKAFVWCCIGLGILNVFLTFLMEGVARYDSWKGSIEETEKLSKAYNQSRLLGLKSQVNPHFLFNSLNSLSSLISEDGEAAEKFLDEMSKVYRYMLRNEDDQLITLEAELKFMESYYFLLSARYGNALQLIINIEEEDKLKYLPPLTLQVIIENAFTRNMVSKNAPLHILVRSIGNDMLEIKNNVQPKKITAEMNHEAGLDNLVHKYRLLAQLPVIIEETPAERNIKLPLIIKKTEVAA
ncbi:sensor histidine kinase [Agriterribacter sp.]|uniref:sensor histidine kinase n=1 Tax=Agriterribacter sp. TaxID=2821509 RepID=UPI002C6AC207|nr:histidine kinase [Agriterribacter sp.]HTN06979.1 histidine kinase [Agriterribacter sp.]